MAYRPDVLEASPFRGMGGTQWCSWLRHCATSRKVAGSITDGVDGIFRWHNPSLGSTQPLKEMSTRNISAGDKGCRCVGLTTSPSSCTNCHEIWNPGGLSKLVQELLYLYLDLYPSVTWQCNGPCSLRSHANHSIADCAVIIPSLRLLAEYTFKLMRCRYVAKYLKGAAANLLCTWCAEGFWWCVNETIGEEPECRTHS